MWMFRFRFRAGCRLAGLNFLLKNGNLVLWRTCFSNGQTRTISTVRWECSFILNVPVFRRHRFSNGPTRLIHAGCRAHIAVHQAVIRHRYFGKGPDLTGCRFAAKPLLWASKLCFVAAALRKSDSSLNDGTATSRKINGVFRGNVFVLRDLCRMEEDFGISFWKCIAGK